MTEHELWEFMIQMRLDYSIGKLKKYQVSKLEAIEGWSWEFADDEVKDVAIFALSHFTKQKDINAFMALENKITTLIKAELEMEM
jgi:hypothetical protein